MPDPDPATRDRARRTLALPPSPEVDTDGETVSEFDANGAPDLSDVSPKYLRALARTHTRDALDTLVEIMTSRASNDTAKIACAKELLLRGWGAPGTEADLLKIWLASQPQPEPEKAEPYRFTMPMTVGEPTLTQDD